MNDDYQHDQHASRAGERDGESAAEHFWESHYRQREQVWSGAPNVILAEVAGPVRPSSALDLGCGEGGDAIWLAQRGWRVRTVDISITALRRVAARAAAAGVADRVTCEQHDLARSFPTGKFDLVSAQYLQSPLEFPRERILRAAANAVASGGLLLIVEHASIAPWSWNQDPQTRFLAPAEILDSLELDLTPWQIERLATPSREATGPGGQSAIVKDNVIAIRRLTT